MSASWNTDWVRENADGKIRPVGVDFQVERRKGRGPDRRVRPTPMLSRYTLFGGRRAGDRRGGESTNIYVDRYGAGLVAVMVAIAVLCALDAVLTLLYLQKGGTEANPVMAEVIEWGPRIFIVVKCGITNLGLLVLCLHKNFRYVRGVITAILGVYTALLVYHMYLTTLVG